MKNILGHIAKNTGTLLELIFQTKCI